VRAGTLGAREAIVVEEELIEALALYFPGSFGRPAPFLDTELAKRLIERLLRMPNEAITRTQLNQFLHLMHEAGMSEGFFRYYFLTSPSGHPHAIDRIFPTHPGLNESGLSSLEQLRWGSIGSSLTGCYTSEIYGAPTGLSGHDHTTNFEHSSTNDASTPRVCAPGDRYSPSTRSLRMTVT
jgi:hypothetical protein